MLFSFLGSPCLCASVVQSGQRDSHHLFERFVEMIETTKGGK
jgi:hypothetical protein